MRLNSLIMLLLAIIFGAGGVFVAQQWLAQQQRLTGPVAVEQEAVPRATIVVATADIGFGTPLDEKNLKVIPWAGNALPDGSFASIADMTKDGRRVALSAFSPNEPILKWKISGPGARASLSAVVTEGMRAVAIRVNDVVGVAGFILPGDRVDVFYTRSDNDQAGGPTTDIIIQNVKVLGVNQVADERADKPVQAHVVTVEVSPTDAQKIALAQTTGQLSLSLRSAGSTDQAPAQRVVAAELVSSPSLYVNEFNARKAAQDELNAKLASLDTSVKGQIAALQQRLQDIVKLQTAGDPAARQKLADLEQSLRIAVAAAGSGNSDLKKQLAALQLMLQKVNTKPVAPISPAKLEVEALQVVNDKLTVGVSRGIKRDTYEVQRDVYSDE
jgi:pilus assembly protein CpaB